MINFFFGPKKVSGSTSTFDSCTCCVIKPHAVKNAGVIIDAIQEQGFEVAAVEMFNLKRSEAAEFLEVYDGVLPESGEGVTELCSGPCIAMELRAIDAVRAFREIVGPFDVEMAKAIRSNTLRAKFGVDKVHNAVHCTDLPEDAVSECQYFFELLQN
jgi:nucleoside-diphosphate kinase